MGELIPVFFQEVLPGDVFRHQTAALMRTTALKAPVMHPVQVRIHHFFCPTRLVWSNWEDFITGQLGPDAEVPTHSGVTSLDSYCGVRSTDTVANFHRRVYNKIWNEFFRDQDLQTEVATGSSAIQHVAWGRDYFTQARPEPQQGDAVTVPIDGSPGGLSGLYAGAEGTVSVSEVDPDGTVNAPGSQTARILYGRSNTDLDPMITAGTTGTIDINELRLAFAKQQQAERRARYGHRYVDLLRQWGLRPQDARLQRPELLGGTKQTIRFSEVLATAEGTTVNVGDQFGHGMALVGHRPYRRMFPEHGFVMSLMSVIPRTQYMTATHKQFFRLNPGDYWFPESELEGPQAIQNKEIYSTPATPDDTFGWTGRHDDYRSRFSLVSGEMLTDLDYWHYARDFTSEPALNSDFVKATPTDRVYQDNSNDELRVIVDHQIVSRRPVSQSPMV